MAASPSTTRACRADARLLHHVLDAPPQFGAPPTRTPDAVADICGHRGCT